MRFGSPTSSVVFRWVISLSIRLPLCRFNSIHSRILYIVWIIQAGWNCDIIMINNILKFSPRVLSCSLRYNKQHLVYVYLIIQIDFSMARMMWFLAKNYTVGRHLESNINWDYRFRLILVAVWEYINIYTDIIFWLFQLCKYQSVPHLSVQF